jgi:hypothetical protein
MTAGLDRPSPTYLRHCVDGVAPTVEPAAG